MSYDFYLTIDTGGPEPAVVEDIGNYTSNIGAMFVKAFEDKRGVKSLDDMKGAEAGLLSRDAAIKMEMNMDEYREMDPPNGWGNADGALGMLRKIEAACNRHPKAIFEVSY